MDRTGEEEVLCLPSNSKWKYCIHICVQLLKKETEKLGDLGKKVRRGENWLEIISFENQLKQLKSFTLEVSLLVRTV